MATSSGRAGRTSWTPCCSCSALSCCPKPWLRSVFRGCQCCQAEAGRPLRCCPLLFTDPHCVCSSGGGLSGAQWEDLPPERGDSIQPVGVEQLSVLLGQLPEGCVPEPEDRPDLCCCVSQRGVGGAEFCHLAEWGRTVGDPRTVHREPGGQAGRRPLHKGTGGFPPLVWGSWTPTALWVRVPSSELSDVVLSPSSNVTQRSWSRRVSSCSWSLCRS